ncbi:hypothetical protein GLYMA_04G156752v4 [Glycine max]|nr:hypothetical protein GLYMA_04G156752v4 [Glycine max]KAG4392491.1 hypothetical protein GLYMA_04G156752v4 [Glycine max]
MNMVEDFYCKLCINSYSYFFFCSSRLNIGNYCKAIVSEVVDILYTFQKIIQNCNDYAYWILCWSLGDGASLQKPCENSNPGYLWSWSVAANRSSSLYSS